MVRGCSLRVANRYWIVLYNTIKSDFTSFEIVRSPKETNLICKRILRNMLVYFWLRSDITGAPGPAERVGYVSAMMLSVLGY
jgi:hypothetical protein